MKSTDKFVLVLVASLALLLAGCGGGSSSTAPVDPGPTAGEMAIMQAQTALTTAQAGMSSAMTDAEMAAAYRAIENAANNLVTALTTHGGSSAEIAAAARTGGNAKAMADSLDMKIADAEMKANMAMAATAAKLYAGIGNAPLTSTGDGARSAAYTGTNDAEITVTMDDAAVGDGTDVTQALTEDKKAMVADNHGWAGKRYTASGTDVAGTYEAMVYSNVGEPTMGKKFGGTQAQLDAGDVQYLLANGETAVTTTTDGVAARVASPNFDQSAGLKTFALPDPNTGGATKITVSGSYHGVSGTYSCTPGTAICAVNVAASGFQLGTVASATDRTFTDGGGTWMFTPGDANARVTDVPDAHYASYGWWIHTAEDGKLTVSAFVDDKDDGDATNNVPAASGLTVLQGTATYSGGAAGKYALSSSTGGTNDAGHFTARATLQADFSKNVSANGITGTIDQFVGADGNTRNWEVELMGSAISAGGLIRALNADGTTEPVATDAGAKTKWTIDGTAGSASGQWTGSLQVNGADGVPMVGTGTFYSTHGPGNSMVGAFGVNKE